MVYVMGKTSGPGSLHEIPMTAGVSLVEDGIVLAEMMPPPMMCLGLLAFSGARGWVSLPKAIHPGRTLSIMAKVRDNLDGMIHADGVFSKPIDYETWWKLNKGAILAEEILQKAGVKRDDIVKTSVVIGAHPAGTVRIGEMLDRDCQTPIKNCYCMDASVFPEPFGMPPTVTILALARRLAKRLTEGPRADVLVQQEGSASRSRSLG
jgi:hypothetical protein